MGGEEEEEEIQSRQYKEEDGKKGEGESVLGEEVRHKREETEEGRREGRKRRKREERERVS